MNALSPIQYKRPGGPDAAPPCAAVVRVGPANSVTAPWGWLLIVALGAMLLIGVVSDLNTVEQNPAIESVVQGVAVAVACGFAALLALARQWPGIWYNYPQTILLYVVTSLQALSSWGRQTEFVDMVPLLAYLVSGTSLLVIAAPAIATNAIGLKILSRMVMVLTVILACFGIMGSLGIERVGPLELWNKHRNSFFGLIASGGILTQSLTLATQCGLALLLCAHELLVPATRKRSVWVVLVAVVCFCGMIGSNGRGAMVSFGVSITIYWILVRPKAVPIRAALASALIFFGTVSLFAWIETNNEARAMLRWDEGDSKRSEMWAWAWEYIKDEPLLGYGYRASEAITADLGFLPEFSHHAGAGFHNSFIDMAVNHGVATGLLYLLLYLSPAIAGLFIRCDQRDRAFAVAIGCFAALSSMTVPYNIGGVRITSMSIALFLGIAFCKVFKPTKSTPKHA